MYEDTSDFISREYLLNNVVEFHDEDGCLFKGVLISDIENAPSVGEKHDDDNT